MKIIWNDKAWEEYVQWQTIDRKIVKKIIIFIYYLFNYIVSKKKKMQQI